MTGKMQALQIVLDNDRDPGCTEKLAMTRAWGDRYRAEATGYMRRKAYYFKRNFWAMNIHWKVWESHLRGPDEEIYGFNDETGQYENDIQRALRRRSREGRSVARPSGDGSSRRRWGAKVTPLEFCSGRVRRRGLLRM